MKKALSFLLAVTFISFFVPAVEAAAREEWEAIDTSREQAALILEGRRKQLYEVMRQYFKRSGPGIAGGVRKIKDSAKYIFGHRVVKQLKLNFLTEYFLSMSIAPQQSVSLNSELLSEILEFPLCAGLGTCQPQLKRFDKLIDQVELSRICDNIAAELSKIADKVSKISSTINNVSTQEILRNKIDSTSHLIRILGGCYPNISSTLVQCERRLGMGFKTAEQQVLYPGLSLKRALFGQSKEEKELSCNYWSEINKFGGVSIWRSRINELICGTLNYIFSELAELNKTIQDPDLQKYRKNTKLLEKKDKRSRTVVLQAYDQGIERITNFIIGCGANLEAIDSQGNSLAHRAVQRRDKAMLVLLSDGHAEIIDRPNKQGMTPLQLALNEYDGSAKSKEIIACLVDNEANIGARTRDGKSAMFWAKKKQRRNSLENLLRRRENDVKLEDLKGLPEEAMNMLHNVTEFFTNTEARENLGVSTPQKILLVGPQGTGKTSIARALANEVGCSFEHVSASDLIERWAGAASENLRKVFAKAREQAPCILFLDEIDSIAARSNNSCEASREHNKTVNQLKTLLEGFDGDANAKVLVIAATNNEEFLDQAILGRFKLRIQISLPDEDGRIDLLQHFIDQLPLVTCEDDDYVETLAGKMIGFSGRDIKGFIEIVMQQPASRIAFLRRRIRTLKCKKIKPRERANLEEELEGLTEGGCVPLTQQHFNDAFAQVMKQRRRAGM